MKNLNMLFIKENKDDSTYGTNTILFAVRIMLPGNQVGEATEYMNNHFYGEVENSVSSAGHFKYLPFDKELQNKQFFNDVDNGKHKELINQIYKERVKLIDGNTQIEIMINSDAIESLEEEVKSLSMELNEFVERGFALFWEQIDLNSVTLTETEKYIAEKEGWEIAYTNKDSSEFTIKKSASSDIFSNDQTAWDFVISQVLISNPLHCKALELIKNTSKGEFKQFIKDATLIDVSSLSKKEAAKHRFPWVLKLSCGRRFGFSDEKKAIDAHLLYRNLVGLDPIKGD